MVPETKLAVNMLYLNFCILYTQFHASCKCPLKQLPEKQLLLICVIACVCDFKSVCLEWMCVCVVYHFISVCVECVFMYVIYI